MNLRMIELGDLHAELWEGMTIAHRRVEGPEDVTVGEHPELGLVVVSHYGLENRIEWFTQRPIRQAGHGRLRAFLTDGDCKKL